MNGEFLFTASVADQMLAFVVSLAHIGLAAEYRTES
jgi:hypothetical protein